VQRGAPALYGQTDWCGSVVRRCSMGKQSAEVGGDTYTALTYNNMTV